VIGRCSPRRDPGHGDLAGDMSAGARPPVGLRRAFVDFGGPGSHAGARSRLLGDPATPFSVRKAFQIAQNTAPSKKARNHEVLFRSDPLVGVSGRSRAQPTYLWRGVSHPEPWRVESVRSRGLDHAMIFACLPTCSWTQPRFACILNVYPRRVRCGRQSKNGATVWD